MKNKFLILTGFGSLMAVIFSSYFCILFTTIYFWDKLDVVFKSTIIGTIASVVLNAAGVGFTILKLWLGKRNDKK